MISKALKLLRVYHNIKQFDLAKRLGISPSHLSEIENGTKPVSYDLLTRYSEIFRVPVSSITLFAESTAPNKRESFHTQVTEKALKLLEWVDSVTSIEKRPSKLAKHAVR